MDCFSELTLSIYVDGELEAKQAGRLESHLKTCAACRKLVAELQAEAQALRQILQASAPCAYVAPQPAVFGSLHVLWALAAIGLVAMSMNALSAELVRLRPPAALQWLNPLSVWFQLSLALSGLAWLLRGGVAMFFQNLSIATVSAFAIGCGCILWRRRPAAMAAGLFAAILALPSAASATQTRFPKGGDKTATVAAGEVIDDTLLIGGQTALIEGTVTGDVIAMAQRVRVTGAVRGSLICMAKELEVDGEVGGDVYSMTELVTVRGSVQRNVHSLAKRLGLEPGGRVARDVFVAAEGAKIDGSVGGEARACTEWIEVPGSIAKDLRFTGERLLVSGTGRVGGDVIAKVRDRQAVEIDNSAEIHGITNVNAAAVGSVQSPVKIQIQKRRSAVSRYSRARFYVWQIARLAAACLTGLLFFWLAPGLFEPTRETGITLLRSGGLGFATLVAVPVAALLLGITLIGLPVALLVLAAWLVTMYLASVLVATQVGRFLLRSSAGNGRSFLLALLLGLLILRIAVNLPWVGGIIGFLVLVLGVGMVASRTARLWRRVQAA